MLFWHFCDLFQQAGILSSICALGNRACSCRSDYVRWREGRRLLLNHGVTSEPILFEKGLTVWEHAEYAAFVKEAVYNLIVANWVVHYVPE